MKSYIVKPNSDSPPEQALAEELATYLESLDNGNSFEVSEQLSEMELVDLAQLGKAFKTTFQEVPVPTMPRLTSNKESRSKHWLFRFSIMSIPIAGMAGWFLAVNLQNNKIENEPTFVASSAVDTQEELTAIIEELDSGVTVTEFDSSLAELDIITDEMEAILDDESFADIDSALASAAL